MTTGFFQRGDEREGSGPSLHERAGGPPLSILLVEEDDEEAARLTASLNEARSPKALRLERVALLSEALLRLELDPDRIVLLDLALPDSEGVDAVRRLVNHAPRTPIVVHTSRADGALAVEALRAGAQDYLVKGSGSASDLLRTLHFAGERHRLKRTLLAQSDELAEDNARLTRLSMVDDLTEALDRRGLRQALKRELEWARRQDSILLELLIDVDDLGGFNEVHGRGAGDRVLRDITRAIQASIRTTDHVGRVDSDQFLVLLPATDLREGCLVAERVRLAASGTRRHPIAGHVGVTVSLGLAQVPNTVETLDDALELARRQLHRAKGGGKNRFAWDDEGAGRPRPSLEDVLERIRTGQELAPVKQRIAHLATGRIAGYEVLMRTTIPGYEQPDSLFAACAEAGLMTVVDQQCFEQCVVAGSDVDGDLKVHINVLPSTLVDLPAESLLRAFPTHRPPSSWCIEISEQRLPTDAFALTEIVRRLKESGVSIAVDDIGYGHSSFESLVILEPDVFKIDKRMVTGIGADPGGRGRALERIVSVAQALGAEIIAEGIESAADMEVLSNLGIEYGQGFFWGEEG